MSLRASIGLVLACLVSAFLTALEPEVLDSVRAIPPEIAGRFRNPRGFQQSEFGQYFIFDRRAHAVFGVDEPMTGSWRIAQIGAEPGRILRPTAFSVAADGTFAVADAPNGRERVQIFNVVGFRVGGFTLPPRKRPRATFDDIVVNDIASLHYTGQSVLISQPETGSLVVEYSIRGDIIRTLGNLRATGHEDDQILHHALNSGIPLPSPGGGVYYVFQAGRPEFRKYDIHGHLIFERLVQGREVDSTIAELPTEWRHHDDELPLVEPTIKTAAVDRHGNLWLSLVRPYTYVYDEDGDKIRTVQFRATGIISPTSLFFGPRNRVLVTPGLYEFDVGSSVPQSAEWPDQRPNIHGSS